MEAAAGIVLSPALQVLFDRLASPALQKLSDIWGVENNLLSLRRALERVEAILEDAEEQQLTHKAVRLWLSNLKNAASDTEDLLDFSTAYESLMYQVRIFCSPGLQSAKGYDPEKIRKTLQMLEMTLNEGLLGFNFKEQPSTIDRRSTIRETSSFVIEKDICGRKDDKEKLVNLLLSSEASPEGWATCIPIIGIGGIGKTTLAQLAYNEDRVIKNFDLRMWVSVSEDFNVKKIMKTVIESATMDECKFSEIDILESQLWHSLHKRRFLIVLDDVWTHDQDDWDKLRPLFRQDVEGCKVIVTSRSKKIAFMMDSPSSPYYLESLSEDDCWDLFKKRAFGRGEEEEYACLFPIGKQIVKKCGGMPLAAKSLGSVMRFKREEQQWLFMRDCELWKLDESQHKVLPALMLSYHHLPSHLRQCFAFCSIFPKNYEYKKEKLIHLWMAEGFIPEDGPKRPEDIGNEYFSELLWISFFQEVELCNGSDIIGYKMNDIIHDLAQYAAGNESLILERGPPPNSLADSRHSSVVYKYAAITIPETLYEAKHLRTLLLIGESGLLENTNKMFSSFQYLRVLDLNSCDVSDLPESLGGLLCLRYLDLSYTPISRLPESTRNLLHLQTLNLFGCHNLEGMPFLGGMKRLRHLNLTGCLSLTQMPGGIGRLHQLQTLPLHVVSGSFDLSELSDLDLSGKLNITHLENARFNRQKLYLHLKKNLESLGLYWGSEHVVESFMRQHKAKHQVAITRSHIWRWRLATVEEILDCLLPHKNLKKLLISDYPGIRFAHWALPENLITVDFINCKNCEHLPALGNLMLLKTLSLHGMDGVKIIGTEFYGGGAGIWFPSLEELSLSDSPNLEEWSCENNRNAFPKLRKLIVKSCPKLAHIPFSQSLQHLELRDCQPTLMSTPNLTLLSVLVLEKIPELFSLPEGLFASAHLSSLQILSCPMLRSLPWEMILVNLSSLKSLTIRQCPELFSLQLSLKNLKALESLDISDYCKIDFLLEGEIEGLSTLRTLSIENCSNLTSLSSTLESLTSLEKLAIMNCPNLHSFPEVVEHLSALRSLTICSCPWFDSLPEGLQNARTLHSLEISCCTNLTALPEWIENLASLTSLTIFNCPDIKQLPAGLKLLSKLQHLCIQECPELEERCRQTSGEDWCKIEHVRHKYIGPLEVRQSSKASTSGGSSLPISSQSLLEQEAEAIRDEEVERRRSVGLGHRG